MEMWDKGRYAIWPAPPPVGLPVLGVCGGPSVLRRFALSTVVAPSIMFSTRSGLAKSAVHKGVEVEAGRLRALREGSDARERLLEGTWG